MIKKIEQLWPIIKKSMKIAFAFVTFINTVAGVIGYTIRDFNNEWSWWQPTLILLGCFVVASAAVFGWLYHKRNKSYITTINGSSITIKVADIFEQEGWKVIGFNEFFDTTVGDGIIEEGSLNGIMIKDHVENLSDLQAKIAQADQDTSHLKSYVKNDRKAYPLGRVIDFNGFLMLALSHFDDQNKAYIDIDEYEQLLFRFWKELRRVYNGKEISIPLLGTGIMDIHGMGDEKDYTALLRCILCTLKKSTFQPKNGITIVVTSEAMSKIDMSRIREEF